MSNAMRVLMLGPDLQVRGGVAAVESALIASLPPEIQVTQLSTMVEGSKWRKLVTFAAGDRAHARAAAQPPRHRPHSFREPREQRAQDAAGPDGAGAGARLIMHAHGGGYRDYWAGLSPTARAATVQTLCRAHCLIVLGETWREFFASVGVPRERIVVVPNPVCCLRSCRSDSVARTCGSSISACSPATRACSISSTH